LLPTGRDRGFEPRLSLKSNPNIESKRYYLLLNLEYHLLGYYAFYVD